MKPIKDLLAVPPIDRRFLWDDLLPIGGLSIVAGKPKAGKSTFIRNLIAMVANCPDNSRETVSHGAQEPSGGVFDPPDTLSHPEKAQRGFKRDFLGIGIGAGPVLYLALQDDEPEIARAFRDLRISENAPLYVECGARQFRSDQLALEWLATEIDRVHPVLCVVDTLFHFFKPRSITNYASVVQVMGPLLTLARETRCHILTVHHTTKGASRAKEPMSAILGSTAIFGTVDSAFVVETVDDWDARLASFRKVVCRLKYGRGFPHTPTRFYPQDWIPETVYKRIDADSERITGAYQEYWDIWASGLGDALTLGAPESTESTMAGKLLN